MVVSLVSLNPALPHNLVVVDVNLKSFRQVSGGNPEALQVYIHNNQDPPEQCLKTPPERVVG